MIFSEADIRRIVREELYKNQLIPGEDGVIRVINSDKDGFVLMTEEPIKTEPLVKPHKRKYWWSF